MYVFYTVPSGEGFPDQCSVPSTRQHGRLPQTDQGLGRTCCRLSVSTQGHRNLSMKLKFV